MTEASKPDVAVVGADTPAGAAILDLLIEHGLPLGQVHALALAEEAAGGTVAFGNRELKLGSRQGFDFSNLRLAWFAPGAGDQALEAARDGCLAISLGEAVEGAARVMPELMTIRSGSLFTLPSALATSLLLALKPLADAVGIGRVDVATYEAVSDDGSGAAEELGRQTADLLSFRSVQPRVYDRQIAFNVIPQVGVLDDDGHSRQERRIADELRQFLGEELAVNVTCARVPVFYGHSAAVHLQLRRPLDADGARRLLASAAGVEVVDPAGQGRYPTAVGEASGQDAVFVGRIRNDVMNPCGLNLWVVSDNIRRGVALGAVRLAEDLLGMLA